MHLIIDGRADGKKLESRGLIYDILESCPDMIGMTKIAPPYVFRYVGVKPKDWGITGIVLIAESHIAIHTYPEYGLVNIDVFSCKGFDAESAVKYFKEALGLTSFERIILDRGIKEDI